MVFNKHIVLVTALIFGCSVNVFAAKQQITSSKLPAALAPYSQAILSTSSVGDKTLYMSGILPINKRTGDLVDVPFDATLDVMGYITALLNEVSMTWHDVVDVMILLRDINDFQNVSRAYGDYLSSLGVEILPVRVCYQAELPKNAVVEIKATAVKNAS